MPPKRTLESHQSRQQLTLEQKIAVLNYIKANPTLSQTDVANHFRAHGYDTITQPSVSRLLKDTAKLYELSLVAGNLRFKRQHIVEFPEVEAALEKWILQAMTKKMAITGDLIQAKARNFAQMNGIEPENLLSLSHGWLDSFKAHHGLKQYQWHGDAGSVPLTSVEAERERMKKVTDSYALRDMWNMDEMGLFSRMPPNHGLATTLMSGMKAEKSCLTYAFTVNANGSEHLPPFILGKSARPRCFEKRSGEALGSDYHWKAKAWMTGQLFSEV